MGVVPLKIGLLVAMIVLTVMAGLLPIWLLKLLRKKAASAQSQRQQNYVSLMLCLLTCFSGGVFLATCFLHLFPELHEHLEAMRETYKFDPDYPLAELLACAGFFLLFFLEEVVLYLIPSMAHGHAHGHTDLHNHDLSLLGPNSCAEEHDLESSSNQKESASDASFRHFSHSHSDGAVTDSATPEAGTNSAASALNGSNAPLLNASIHPPANGLRTSQSAHSPPIPPKFSTTSCTRSECPATVPLALAEPERCERNCERVKEDPPILMKSRPHAHSHSTRSATIVLAIAFHAIIEGLALGVQEDAAKVWAIWISLMVHKLVVAFSVGLQLARTHAHALHWVVLSMVLIASMTPLGGVAGMLVQSAPMAPWVRDIVVLICHGVAVGTFLYVTFFEVLIHERDNEHPNLLKLLTMLLGFVLIGVMRLLAEGHSHSHSEAGHSHSHGEH